MEEIKKYLYKMINFVCNGVETKFFGYKFIKKSKVDDILCCLLSSVPYVYKQKIELDIKLEQEGLSSINLYKRLLKESQNTFFIYPAKYFINVDKLKIIIDTLIPLLEKDIAFLESKSIKK